MTTERKVEEVLTVIRNYVSRNQKSLAKAVGLGGVRNLSLGCRRPRSGRYAGTDILGIFCSGKKFSVSFLIAGLTLLYINC